jgi:hypothetical protein
MALGAARKDRIRNLNCPLVADRPVIHGSFPAEFFKSAKEIAASAESQAQYEIVNHGFIW